MEEGNAIVPTQNVAWPSTPRPLALVESAFSSHQIIPFDYLITPFSSLKLPPTNSQKTLMVPR